MIKNIYLDPEEALKEWDNTQELGDPRFAFKHAIRLQGLYLHEDNEITNMNGRPYAYLKEVKWKNETILEAKVKLNNSEAYHRVMIDIGKLK